MRDLPESGIHRTFNPSEHSLNLANAMPFKHLFQNELDERRPSKLLLLLEGRALWELSSLPWALPWLMTRVPRGDGHPVLVLPGLMADDYSTVPLRRFLAGRGYEVAGWGQGRNYGPRAGVLTQMREQLAEMHARTGRKVSVIGWSLGGVYARELARFAPEQVRQVITLGSPLYGDPHTSTNAWGVYKLVSGKNEIDPADRGDGPPPGVPMTSIFSRTDGVVGWGCSIEKEGPLTDNIEIRGATHIGLGVHPLVLYAVGDRLAQAEDGWTQFKPRGLVRALYPAQTPVR
jgi:pimeloyl-ACP methyl ester carboxylesterase